MDTTGKDIPGWDSATFINFVVAVEMEFGVRLGLATIESIESFGDMVRAIKAAKP
jgi:acyl carrier protein